MFKGFQSHLCDEILPAFKDVGEQLGPVLKGSSSNLIPALLLVFVPLQALVMQSQQSPSLDSGAMDPSFYLLAGLNFLKYIVFIFVFSLRTAEVVQKTSPIRLGSFFLARWAELLRENLRALARILLGLVLLILPGLFLALRYSFVNLLVLFDSRHPRGELDALKESWQLTRGWMMLPLSLFLILGASADFAWEALTAWLRQAPGEENFFTLYLVALVVDLGRVFVLLISQIFLLSLFRSRRGRAQPLNLELSVPARSN